MSATGHPPPDRRSLWKAYAIGLFGMGYIDVFVILTPLYALQLELSATKIGILVGMRTVLTLIFSIHIGTLMDRFGSLRVMRVFVLIAMVLAPVYPMVDSFFALLALQIVVGGAKNESTIGILVGMRTVLTLIFSIHIGTLMDRFGSLRVMRVFVLIAMVLAPVYPMVDSFLALLALQIVVGGAVSFGWAGGQTLIAQIGHGDAGYIGRFSFASRIGTTAAPLIAGAVWDLGGAWPGYLLASLWGVVPMRDALGRKGTASRAGGDLTVAA